MCVYCRHTFGDKKSKNNWGRQGEERRKGRGKEKNYDAN
jgi:hypothetical protein